MHIFTRLVAGALLILIALTARATVQEPQFALPPLCQELVFSTEEDFVTQGPEPPDGNPIISDGDLLGIYHDVTGAVQCLICARNRDLLEQPFDVSVDIGLDAVDVIDAEQGLLLFSTELNSANTGQFTAGDLLISSGAIIPNVALTALFQAGYDLGLDAVHLVGEPTAIRAWIDAATQYNRGDWLQNPELLSELLTEFGVDIWFSTEQTLGPVDQPVFLDGDLLSARTGTIVAPNADLLPAGVPAGIPSRGVDFGLDAVSGPRTGLDALDGLEFSTELLFEGEPPFTDGDVLQYANGVVSAHLDLGQCFKPRAGFVGLDAFHIVSRTLVPRVYLPLIFASLD